MDTRTVLGLIEEKELISIGESQRMQAPAAEAFLKLQSDARENGIDLCPVSAFRSCQKQINIWNGKAQGTRPLLSDSDGRIDPTALDELALVHAIMRFSALPGASRHHWGTDVDVIDRAAVPENYQIQLSCNEAREHFSRLHAWLDERIAQDRAHGFFRPYAVDRGGISPEPWHLSYAPIAREYQQSLTPTLLKKFIEDAELELKQTVLKNLEGLFAQFIEVPWHCYPKWGLPLERQVEQ